MKSGDGFVWPDGLLEPVLITFNRVDYAEATIRSLADLCRAGMRLHILDNASTDGTDTMVARLSDEVPNLVYHRNKYNIGGNANILRSVELSDSYYHWVIGDDDDWHVDEFHALIKILRSESADIIRLGWLVSGGSRGRMCSARVLAELESMFFASCTMISSVILKRSLVVRYLRFSYSNVGDFLPQIVPLLLAINANSDLLVYSLDKDFITHRPNEDPAYFVGDYEWPAVWVRTSRFIADDKLKRIFNGSLIGCAIFPKVSFFSKLLYVTRVGLVSSASRLPQVRSLMTIFTYGSGLRCYFVWSGFVCLITPGIVAQLVLIYYYRLTKGKRYAKEDFIRTNRSMTRL